MQVYTKNDRNRPFINDVGASMLFVLEIGFDESCWNSEKRGPRFFQHVLSNTKNVRKIGIGQGTQTLLISRPVAEARKGKRETSVRCRNRAGRVRFWSRTQHRYGCHVLCRGTYVWPNPCVVLWAICMGLMLSSFFPNSHSVVKESVAAMSSTRI